MAAKPFQLWVGKRCRHVDTTKDLDYCEECFLSVHNEEDSSDYQLARREYDEKLQEAWHDKWGWTLQVDVGEGDKILLMDCLEHVDGMMLRWLPPLWRQDNEVVMAACRNNHKAIRYASPKLIYDREFALEFAVEFTSGSITGADLLFGGSTLGQEHQKDLPKPPYNEDKEFMLQLVTANGLALQHASPQLKSDKEIVLAACQNQGSALKYASQELRDDKHVVSVACHRAARVADALVCASSKIQDDKEFIMGTLQLDGYGLQFASKRLREDKDIVLTAVKATPSSLKCALGNLNQDPDCLVAAGIWDGADNKDTISHDDDNNELTKREIRTTLLNVDSDEKTSKPIVARQTSTPKARIVLSTRFSLNEESTSTATEFAVALKRQKIIQENFAVYSPNAYAKSACDPDWTSLTWPCRGTYNTCQMDASLKPPKGEPLPNGCCWRHSFRHQLETARNAKNGGAMVQLVECDPKIKAHALGNGQLVEAQMAQDVGIKVFKCYAGRFSSPGDGEIGRLVLAIKEWRESDCTDMSECEVFPFGSIYPSLSSFWERSGHQLRFSWVNLASKSWADFIQESSCG